MVKGKRMKNVLIVSALDRIAPRIRIEKETLEKEGYRVSVFSQRRIVWGWKTFITLPVRYFRIVKEAVRLRAEMVELTHLAHIVVSPFLKLLGKVVIYDAYDRYSLDISEKYFPEVLKKAAIAIVEFFENVFIKCFVDAMFTVSTKDEYLYNRYRRHCKIVEVLYNVPPPDICYDGDLIRKFENECFRIVYAGGFNAEKGLNLLKALAVELAKTEVRHELHLVGRFLKDEMRSSFLSDVRALGVSEQVFFNGYLEYPDLVRFLYTCHIGLSPYLKIRRFEAHGIGTSRKNFTYMAAGTVVIASEVGQSGEAIRQQKCGYLLEDPEDVKAIASIIQSLYNNRELAREMASNGLKAINDRYNWNFEKEKVTSTYEKVVKCG
jgi:glycosyltransferase involved in cell wall biosynthesis